ncbi:MAG: hypothetical protein ACRCXK_13190 [Wohlfahrtiimonas sp.]
MKITIRQSIALSMIFVCSVAYSEPEIAIEWLEPINTNLGEMNKDIHPEVLERVHHRYKSDADGRKFDRDPEITKEQFEIFMYQYDFNNDGLSDYWIQYRSGFCGSAGCETEMLLSHKDESSYQVVPFSHFEAPYGKLGIGDNHSVFLISPKFRKVGGGRCGAFSEWKLVGDKFRLVQSLECLP